MIRKIILENYMAHVHTVIEPAAGLTVLLGPNNCGKSAVIHALEMICYNSEKADFAIRHGSKKAVVTVETQDVDGTVHTLVWWRKKNTAGYIIDGRPISGMGKGNIPDDLHQYLRMPEIPAASKPDFRIHFGLQKSPIFLLDGQASESRAAQFFASASDADRLMEMQRRHKVKEANAKRDKVKLDDEIAKLDQQLSDLLPLSDISLQLAKLDTAFDQIGVERNQFLGASRLVDEIARARSETELGFMRVGALIDLNAPPSQHSLGPLRNHLDAMGSMMLRAETNSARSTALVGLKPAPEIARTAALAKLITEMTATVIRHGLEDARLRATQSLQEPPRQSDTRAVVRTLERFATLSFEWDAYRIRSEILMALSAPPILVDPTALNQRVAGIESAQQQLRHVESLRELLNALPEPPQQLEVTAMRDFLDRLASSTQASAKAEALLQTCEHRLSSVFQQIEDFVRLNPRCHSCGQIISPELVIARGSEGHTHG